MSFVIDLYDRNDGWTYITHPKYEKLSEAIKDARIKNKEFNGDYTWNYYGVIDLDRKRCVWDPVVNGSWDG